ncbi:redoxin [Drechmeria coniospora]|uniref:Thioredoxin peroxidase n=1 Tax=Drechmeria coniospora TaxID=98403 RepID=A0A151GRT5_DRECN|nr:redoxin [Drechmeria coniospora]KYK59800.1 redoxin [Drechmeria coniospora]ODA78600.1 hypothetical protein RJ55_05982 [Drechmeria coniospora]
MPLNAGDSFPDDVAFTYIPAEEAGDDKTCGVAQNFDASKEFKDKKVVLVSVPGAFTPTCHVSHLPSYLGNRAALKAKGVDQVVIIAYNDAYVMSGWCKANGVKDDYFIFASDSDAKFSKSIGWTNGERTARYAIAVDHGKVVYAGLDKGKGLITHSGADAVLAKL